MSAQIVLEGRLEIHGKDLILDGLFLGEELADLLSFPPTERGVLVRRVRLTVEPVPEPDALL